jgi:hypothetical protein
MILIPAERIAYVISEQPDGEVLMQEKPLSEVICFPYRRADDEPVAAAGESDPQESPPILSSRPGATAVLYLDFDGETVTDPSWDNGNTIVAQPSTLTSAQVTEVWNRVKEDYWPFNIDVTTDVTRYNNAPVGRRMRCIITPTNWQLGGAGVAYLNSFAQAGKGQFSSTIPCWCFNTDVVGVASTVSHELGHTLGLRHDGRTSPVEEYYTGHGSGAVGWGPIMGSGAQQLEQWSKGEYLNAVILRVKTTHLFAGSKPPTPERWFDNISRCPIKHFRFVTGKQPAEPRLVEPGSSRPMPPARGCI